ncbi:ATP synthase subunit I [bacterium]|nr:ATP synthase subunit I [candidate division CSSED10-310 bacterium]
MIRRLTVRVFGTGAAILALMCLISGMTGHPEMTAGIAGGGVIGALNFAAICLLTTGLFKPGRSALKYLLVPGFLVKLCFWGFILYFLMVKLHVSGIGLIWGLTAIVVSTIISFLSLGLKQVRE